MTQQLMILDGTAYRLHVVSLKRSFQVLDTDNSGRVIEAGQLYRDIVGTFYNYELRLTPVAGAEEDYHAFYDAISSPAESHLLTLPYGREGTLTQRMYVTGGTDELKRQERGRNIWNGLTVKYVATRACRLP